MLEDRVKAAVELFRVIEGRIMAECKDDEEMTRYAVSIVTDGGYYSKVRPKFTQVFLCADWYEGAVKACGLDYCWTVEAGEGGFVVPCLKVH